MRPLVAADEQTKLDQLQTLYQTKLEIDAHFTLQKALRWWLYAHAPPSIVMIGLLGFHIFTVLYY